MPHTKRLFLGLLLVAMATSTCNSVGGNPTSSTKADQPSVRDGVITDNANMAFDGQGSVVSSTEAIEALEVVLRDALNIGEPLPRMAFGMLDPTDAGYWVLDVRRQSRLLPREAPTDVALTITLRPRTLLELL
jgi:hypothetical protein